MNCHSTIAILLVFSAGCSARLRSNPVVVAPATLPSTTRYMLQYVGNSPYAGRPFYVFKVLREQPDRHTKEVAFIGGGALPMAEGTIVECELSPPLDYCVDAPIIFYRGRPAAEVFAGTHQP